MVSSVVFLSLLALAVAGNIQKRDVDNPCYRCSRWDALGNGFMQSDDPRQCSYYIQCFKVESQPISEPLYRLCPPGTWTDFFDTINGNPCTKRTCDPAECDDCDIGDFTTVIPVLECHFLQGADPWIINRVTEAGDIVPYGSCGINGYFNDTDGICTCTEIGEGCSCRINIPLTSDINDISCHKAWVGQTGLPVLVTVEADGPIGTGFSGVFNGFDQGLQNAGHLSTYSLDGAFAGGWVFELTFVAWFKLDTSYSTGTWGVLSMGDCANGPAFAIWVVDSKVYAQIELMDGVNVAKYTIESVNSVTTDRWYFASVVYNSTATESLKLYVFDETEYAICSADPFDPILCPQAAPANTNAAGPVSPRGCGLTIGHTSTDNEAEFFIGRISQVKVSQTGDNPLACV